MARRRRNPPSTERGSSSPQAADTSLSPDASSENLPAVVQQEIDQELSQLEPQLQPQTRVHVRRSMVRIAHEVAEFSGPLPPSSYLRDYETILPGAADRIIAMAEKEQTHRHGWERSALRNTTIGLWFGFVIAVGLVGGGIYSVSIGQPYVAGIFLAASAVGMVPALIKGREFIIQRQKRPDNQTAKPIAPKGSSRSPRYNSN
jgi:uncharacterized membrane protein